MKIGTVEYQGNPAVVVAAGDSSCRLLGRGLSCGGSGGTIVGPRLHHCDWARR